MTEMIGERSGTACSPYVVLIPAWGKQYVQQAIRYPIASMMAPNNLPAIARQAPVRVMFLTDRDSIPIINNHPFWQNVKEFCELITVDISDTIFWENYGVTLTLGYARGIQEIWNRYGKGTVALLSNADITFSDGSLSYVFDLIEHEADGVAMTGVRCDQTGAIPNIERYRDIRGILTLDADFLVDQVFAYPHATDLAQTLGNPYTHHVNANHLYFGEWGRSIVGFWFLRAPLAIRLMRPLDKVESFGDYSFLPQLVDEARIARPTDGQRLFMLELSEPDQEAQYIRNGAANVTDYLAGIKNFANAHHRINGRTPYFIYRSQDKGTIPALRQRFDAAFAEVDAALGGAVQPVEGHFYWNSAIASLLHHGHRMPSWVSFDRQKVEELRHEFQRHDNEASWAKKYGVSYIRRTALSAVRGIIGHLHTRYKKRS
jgi:hypothetical protein